MSRNTIYLAALFVTACGSRIEVKENERYILLPKGSNHLATHFKNADIVAEGVDSSVVRLDTDEIEQWAESAHHHFKACGGFYDVSDKLSKGSSLAEILKSGTSAQQSLNVFPVLPDVTPNDDVKAFVNEISGDKMWEFLTQFSAPKNRSATSDLGTQAAQLLLDRATAIATAAGLDGFSVRRVKTSGYAKQDSIVATLKGTNPELPGIVIGGHMDSINQWFLTTAPGADDDGTGSALVLETLRVIAEKKLKFQRTIHFIWYAAEERGLVGSQNVVEDFQAKGIKVFAAIQFDMTGYQGSGEKFFLIDDFVDENLTKTVEDLAKAYLPSVPVVHTLCEYECSDHANWTRAGIPSAFPFESAFGEDNPNIHGSNDKMGILNKNHATNFAKLAAAFLGEVAKLQ